MYRQIVPAVLEKYNIDAVSIKPAQKGYRSESYPVVLADHTTVNLIFFKRENDSLERIERADYVATIANESGLPVRTRYNNRLLRVTADSYSGIYNYLPGVTVPWEAFTMKHIKLLGVAMGNLHSALHSAAPPDFHSITDEILPLIIRMEKYFTDPDVMQALDTKLAVHFNASSLSLSKKIVQHVAGLPGQQMVHMDMVRGNVLFDTALPRDKWQIDGLALTGVIDFEKATYGHPLFDLARTLAFLIVDSPKPAGKIYSYFLNSGYHKRAGQPLPHPKLLSPLIQFYLIHDFYKFLRHTPYESLHDNYHYNRTSTVLEQYGIISLKH
ncbi:MAG: Phosphotransferase enzyme family [Candidatus Saccharibacteria bacterium]|nr:Phosphotransferase enzyme family [Candidatus Saccharibacteria bacterium]